MTLSRSQLIEVGRRFDQRGWIPATSGNLSAREGTGFWITASGHHKGRLQVQDFVRVSHGGEILERGAPAARPSAETSIHAAVYRRCPDAQAILHVHSVGSTFVTRFAEGDRLLLPNVEILKAFGLWDPAPNVAIEVFDNLSEVPAIARQVDERFEQTSPSVPGFLVRDHGLTAWGTSIANAEAAVEAFELVFQLLIEERRTR